MNSKTAERLNPTERVLQLFSISQDIDQWCTGASPLLFGTDTALWELSMASPPSSVSSTGAHTNALCSVEALELRAEAVPAVGSFSLFAQCLLWKQQKTFKLFAKSKGHPAHEKLLMCFLQCLWSMLKSCFRNRRWVNIPLHSNIRYYLPSVPLLSPPFQMITERKKYQIHG